MANQYVLNVKINGVEQSVKTVGELEDALQRTKDELKNIELGSEAFNDLANQARVIQGELERSFEKATNFNASITVLTESVSRLGSSVAAGFSLATTAIQLLGDESEELTELQVKSQQALTIAFAATTIATNAATVATDLKVIADKLQLGITNLLTAAVGRQTIAKAANAVATGTATVAQIALNAAMSANPILLVVGAIGALIGALAIFASSSKDAKEETENLTDALNRQNDAYENNKRFLDEEIQTQTDLIKLRERVALANAKTEEERIAIAEKTNDEIAKLRQGQVERDLAFAQKQLDQAGKTFSDLVQIRATTEAKFLSETDKQAIALKKNYDKQISDKTLTEEKKLEASQNYYAALFELQRVSIENNDKFSKEEKDAALAQVKAAQDQLFRVKQLTNENKKAGEEQAAIDAETAAKRRQIRENEAREAKARREKEKADRQKDQQERVSLEQKFLDDIAKLNEAAQQNLLALNREFDNILTESFFDSEDVIAQFDANITKLRIDSERAIADAQTNFDKERQAFIKNSEEALERGVITREELNERLKKLDEDFNAQQEARARNASLAVTNIEQDKVAEIARINAEISKERLDIIAEGLTAEIELSNRRIALIRGFATQEIKERQDLEKKAREVNKNLAIQAIQDTLAEELKNVQGTEEQKAAQRETLTKEANARIAIINENFRQTEKEKELENADEVYASLLSKIQEYANLAISGVQGVIGVFSALNELANVNRENELRDLRDFTAKQTDILNQGYNRDLANLQARYERGLISQDQYNSAVEGLQANLNGATQELIDKQTKAELEARKKAFEEEKKLKIANTITSGFQGALQAFVSATSLPFPASLIVGSALASLIAAQTGINVASIKKTKFDSGAPNITPVSSSSINTGGGGAAQQQDNPLVSDGGLTIFNPELTRRPTSSGGGSNSDPTSGGATRVYVLESDISQTQRRVSISENSATIP